MLIGVYTTRAGQTSTSWAVSVAWTLAERYPVLLVDADMQGGTTADVLYVDSAEHSIAHSINGEALTTQIVPVPERSSLDIVPGLQMTCGPPIVETMQIIGSELKALDTYEYVIADLGQPLAHPGLTDPVAAAEAICGIFGRTFVVLKDDPALLARTINVLRAARPPHGELIVCQSGKSHRRAVLETLERELSDLPVRDVYSWDEKRAARAAGTGIPQTFPGIERDLNLSVHAGGRA